MTDTPLARYLRQQPDFNEPSSSSSPLPALYADLAAHRTSNRSSFEASVDWWARLLFKAALRGFQNTTSDSSSKGKQVERNVGVDRLVLHLNQRLVEECTIEEVGRPLSLGTVVIELQSSRHLYPLQAYLSSAAHLQGPNSSEKRFSSTVYNIASFPLIWAFSQLSSNLGFAESGDGGGSESDWKKAKGDWVIMDNVQDLADTVLSIHRSAPRLSPLESLYSLETFRSQLVIPALSQVTENKDSKPISCSELDMRVLLKYMERDRGVAMIDGNVIKLEHSQSEKLSAITEEEKGVVNVKDTYARLESQVEEIEMRIKERQVKLEVALRDKKREQALSHLRSKKMLEEVLEKRTKSMETLHGVLIKIEQAASDVEIVKAYEMSTSSLKALLANERLQPERIEASMDQMQDTIADADEVRRAVEMGNEGVRRAAGEEEMDEEEMEAELKRLEEENEKENDEKIAARTQAEQPSKSNNDEATAVPQERKEEEKSHMEAIAAS